MPASAITLLRNLSDFGERPLDTSVAYILLWAAVANGCENAEANPNLKKHLSSLSLERNTILELVSLLSENRTEDYITAFDIIDKELKREEKQFLLDMVIDVCSSDAKVSASANHLLRLLADFLNFDSDYLASRYQLKTDNRLSEPEDLSSITWWTIEQESKSIDQVTLTRQEALEIMGLNENASPAHIKQAYRRLVQSHHPDRFQAEGKASAEQAESKFLLVQKAYGVLRQ